MTFNFHGHYSPKEKKQFKIVQVGDLKKVCKFLKTDLRGLENIRFEVFDSREGKQEAGPHHSISRASARFSEMTIYRFWPPTVDPHFPHEITHLVAHTWTEPYLLKTELDTWDNKKIKKVVEMVSTSFMQEGLAIAVDDIVFGRKLMEDGELKCIDDWCKEQMGQMPSLEQTINLDGFGSLPNKIVVPFSASVSKFLLKKYGVDKYKQMYIKLKETISSQENIKIIERVYGLKEQELLDEWRISLL
jgi:hypothetical protein